MKRTALVLCLSLLVPPLAAGAQVIDGSSQEAFEKSTAELVEGIAEEDKEAFGQALLSMMLERYPPATGATGLGALAFMSQAVEAAPRTLDGVRFDEIRAKMTELNQAKAARGLNEARAEEERRAAEARAAEERRAAEARAEEAAAAELSLREELGEALRKAGEAASGTAESLSGKFVGEDWRNSELACLRHKVTLEDVRIEPANYGRTLVMNVLNDLPWAISGIRFQSTASTPGRSVPWSSNSHSVSIPGGIEPGEMIEVRSTLTDIPQRAPADVVASAIVLDVADPEARQLVRDVGVMGWNNVPSSLSCFADGESAKLPVPDLTAGSPVAEGVRSCWNRGALSMEAQSLTIKVGFTLDQNGIPRSDSLQLAEHTAENEFAAQQAFEVARRAVLMCGSTGFGRETAGKVILAFGPDGVADLLKTQDP